MWLGEWGLPLYPAQPVPHAQVLRDLSGAGISDSTADTITLDSQPDQPPPQPAPRRARGLPGNGCSGKMLKPRAGAAIRHRPLRARRPLPGAASVFKDSYTIRDKVSENGIVMRQIKNNSAEQALLGDFSKAVDDAMLDSSTAHQNQMLQLLSAPQRAASFARVVFDLFVSGKANPAV